MGWGGGLKDGCSGTHRRPLLLQFERRGCEHAICERAPAVICCRRWGTHAGWDTHAQAQNDWCWAPRPSLSFLQVRGYSVCGYIKRVQAGRHVEVLEC